MKKRLLYLLSLFCIIVTVRCSKESDNKKPSDIWDIDKQGIPKFVGINYLDLSKIYSISKFRSSVGHDYSDSYESCRSMKHYFQPQNGVDWAAINIYAPVTGIITRVEEEWAGTKLEIASDDYPAFRFSIFHINKKQPFNINDKVTKGEKLGTHIGSQTYSDISVIVNDPTKQGRFVSFIEVITDDVFKQFSDRGVNSRQDLIISKVLRDLNPLTCNGDTFISIDTLENWVILK